MKRRLPLLISLCCSTVCWQMKQPKNRKAAGAEILLRNSWLWREMVTGCWLAPPLCFPPSAPPPRVFVMCIYSGCLGANVVVQKPHRGRWLRDKVCCCPVPGVMTSTSPCWHNRQCVCTYVWVCLLVCASFSVKHMGTIDKVLLGEQLSWPVFSWKKSFVQNHESIV